MKNQTFVLIMSDALGKMMYDDNDDIWWENVECNLKSDFYQKLRFWITSNKNGLEKDVY